MICVSEGRKTLAARPLGAVISRDLPPAYQMAFQLAAVEQRWSDVVCDAVLAERSRPAGLERKVLRILCDSPAVAQKVAMSAGTILMRIERRFRLRLEGVRAQVGPVRKRRPAPGPDARPIRLKLDEKILQNAYERAMAKGRNERLALALARLEAASKARFGEKGKPKPSQNGS